MSFNLFEISSILGRPVCLYEFIWGEQHWRYTSADRNIQYPYVDGDPANGTWWTAIPISDNGFSQGAQSDPFTVTMPRSVEMVQLFKGTPPSTSISMVARRFHKDDVGQEATVYWIGTVGSIKGVDAVKAEVTGRSISESIRRTGNRMGWEVNCPHFLFDEGCRADPEAFRHDTTITALAGASVTFASIGYAAERYAGGFLEWDATGNSSMDRRPIDSFVSGTTFALLGRADRLVVGQDVTIYPGCDLSAATCQDFFNNLSNHGGFGFMSRHSPFDGNPIY
jgi:uncharacterized phage protein (TIGR02218 family)